MLDTHQINVFLIAAETLNFTRAAQRLHMSQPSVSQHIQSLEQKFGLPLFNRFGRHIELTDAGVALVPHARELVTRSIQIEEMMESLKGEVYGHLRVGCSTTPGKYILPTLLAEFHREHPRVKVTCSVAPQKESIEMLCDGEVQFALASGDMIPCSDVEFRKFMIDPVVLIAPLGHPWAIRGEIEVEELLEADCILREESSGTRIVVRESLESVGVSEHKLQTLLTLGNSEAIALAVQEGIGIGFVSKLVVTKLVQDRVAIIKIRGLDIRRDVYIGRSTRLSGSAAQAAFWAFVNKKEYPYIPTRVESGVFEFE